MINLPIKPNTRLLVLVGNASVKRFLQVPRSHFQTKEKHHAFSPTMLFPEDMKNRTKLHRYITLLKYVHVSGYNHLSVSFRIFLLPHVEFNYLSDASFTVSSLLSVLDWSLYIDKWITPSRLSLAPVQINLIKYLCFRFLSWISFSND